MCFGLYYDLPFNSFILLIFFSPFEMATWLMNFWSFLFSHYALKAMKPPLTIASTISTSFDRKYFDSFSSKSFIVSVLIFLSLLFISSYFS